MATYNGSVDISHSYKMIERLVQITQHGGLPTELEERFHIGHPKIKMGELLEKSRVAIERFEEMRGFNCSATKMQMSAVGIKMLEQSCRVVRRECEFF